MVSGIERVVKDAAARCLVIAGVFPPAGGAGALRLVKLLKYLPDRRVDVHVVAPAGYAGYFVDRDLETQVSHLRVTRCGRVGMPGTRWLRRRSRRSAPAASTARGWLHHLASAGKRLRDATAIPDEYLGWAVTALLASRRLVQRERVDVIMTASFPYSAHLVGLALKREFELPWWVDMADPWAGHRFRGMDRGLRSRIDRRLEEAVVRRADAVTVASPGMLRRLQERYGKLAADIRLLTNAYDPRDWVDSDAAPRGVGPLRLLFVGSFDARLTPPDPLLAALGELARRRPDVSAALRFEIIGAADLESTRRIREFQARSSGAAMWHFRDFVPHHEALAAMRAADALVLSIADGADWHLTAKVIEYLASNKPVIALAPEGDCRALLERAGAAWVLPPADPGAFAELLDRAVAQGGFFPSTSRRREVVAPFAAPAIARDAAELVHRLAMGTR